MGFFFGFLCGLLFMPLSLLAGAYYFFFHSESYAEKRRERLQQELLTEQEQELDLDDMPPSAVFASYLGQRQMSTNGTNGYMPEHIDPQYQFAGWISVKRIPEVDHRIVEPSLKKESKKHPKTSNGNSNQRRGTVDTEGGHGVGVAGSIGAGAAGQDPRFTYLDTQNPHLSLPPCLQSRFKDSKYGVIRGATMFIYENDLQQECLGVITLPNYQITVPGQQKDSHIYSKRFPIWLKYQPNYSHSRHSTAGSEGSMSSSKDYYLSMVSSVDKEDLYFTLLRCSKLKPSSQSYVREIPKRDSTLFDKSAMNTLIRTIHSNEHQFQAAWLNALIGRMFLGVYKTPQIKDMVLQKMVEKLSRVRLPNFLNHMRMKSVHLGDGVPLITRPKLLTLKPNGDMILDMNILYQGGFRAEVEAEAVVTVTKKIQPIKVSLVLVMTLMRLEGRVQMWIKPPPCNRIWYGFYHKPQVELKIEPVVSDKHIKSNLIIKAIENKMLEAIAETMVLPNMDDIPFSDSDGTGGIFGEDIQPGGDAIPTPSQTSHGYKPTAPRRSHSPGPRSATINVTEVSSLPRSAIEIPSDGRHKGESMAHSTMYQNSSGSRSHVSLGDELLQTNYSYDNSSSTARISNTFVDDPMQTDSPTGRRSGILYESPEAISSKTLQVPGGSSIKLSGEKGSPVNSHDSGSPQNSGGVGSRLLHRKNAASSSSANHNRRDSLDPAPSYASGSMVGNGSGSSPFPGMDARTVEEHWSHHGITEYEPSALDGKGGRDKDGKKKQKDKPRAAEKDRQGFEGDHVSVNSKDSGDSGSTQTGNTFGYGSSQSTLDPAYSLHSHSAKSEKFSLTKMFQGFRKKHTKGAHSGSSLQFSNHSMDTLSRFDDPHATCDDQSTPGISRDAMEGMPYLGQIDETRPKRFSAGDLNHSFLPKFKQKFESTPNLTNLTGYTDIPEERADRDVESDHGNIQGTEVAPEVEANQEAFEFHSPIRQSSPEPSIYAPSLFGLDDPNYLSGQGHWNGDSSGRPSSKTTQASGQHHHHHLLHFSPKFGTALRKLRNRSHGGSGSSKEELSIPQGDLNAVLRHHEHQQQEHQPFQPQDQNQGSGADQGMSGSKNSRVSKEESVLGSSVPSSRSQPEVVDPARIRTFTAPQIVLQKPSPYLNQSAPPSPWNTENMNGRALQGQGSNEGRAETPNQYIPEHLDIHQQPDKTTHFRIESNLVNHGTNSAPSSQGSIVTRPRRHSINHPPSLPPSSVIHHAIFGLGVGPTPASPLRREFTRPSEEDEGDSPVTRGANVVGMIGKMAAHHATPQVGCDPYAEAGIVHKTFGQGESQRTRANTQTEPLHARLGYIGEYPTPVRCHPFLSSTPDLPREGVAREPVDALGNRKAVVQGKEVMIHEHIRSTIMTGGGNGEVCSQTMTRAEYDAMVKDEPRHIRAGPNMDDQWVKNSSTSLKGVVHPSGDEQSGEGSRFRGDSVASSISLVKSDSEQEQERDQQESQQAQEGQQQQQQRQQEQAPQQQFLEAGRYGMDEPGFLGDFQQPPQPILEPQLQPAKKHHRNIFKRLIRRKSDDSMSRSRDETPRVDSALASSPLYQSPGSSLSQVSVGTSSDLTSLSSPFHLHLHHNYQEQARQQEQQQPQQAGQQLQQRQGEIPMAYLPPDSEPEGLSFFGQDRTGFPPRPPRMSTSSTTSSSSSSLSNVPRVSTATTNMESSRPRTVSSNGFLSSLRPGSPLASPPPSALSSPRSTNGDSPRTRARSTTLSAIMSRS